MSEPKRQTIRIDKWLWHARFFKTRGLCAKLVTGGHCRVNDGLVSKASFGVGVGDVLTFSQNDDVRIIQIAQISTRRGPAPEAQELYQDLAPPQLKEKVFRAANPEADRSGRPNRQERQAMAKLKDNS